MFDLEKSLNEFKAQADWVSLRYVNEKTHWRWIRDERPQGFSSNQDQGVMVEVFVDGQFGYAGTSDISSEGLRRAFLKAKQMTSAAAAFGVHKFSLEQRPAHRGHYQSPHLKSFDSLALSELTDILIGSSKVMKLGEKVVSRLAGTMMVEVETQQVSSSGADLAQNFAIVSTNLSTTSTDGKESQTRTDAGGLARCLQIGAEVFNREDILQRSERIARESLELLSADNCPTDTMDLILAPDQMTLQIHESIGHPLEYDRILGDERNYAG